MSTSYTETQSVSDEATFEALMYGVLPDAGAEQTVNWRNSASCKDTSPDLFFPVGQTGPAIEHIANAKAVCESCAVSIECLEYALMTNQDAGIWGGLTEDERRKIRRERRRQNRK